MVFYDKKVLFTSQKSYCLMQKLLKNSQWYLIMKPQNGHEYLKSVTQQIEISSKLLELISNAKQSVNLSRKIEQALITSPF